MLTLNTENIGKKYIKEWIFKGLNLSAKSGEPLAIVGPNGSGKSTLIHSIAGTIPISEGTISYSIDGINILEENINKHITFAAPYQNLIESFTLQESIKFHSKFRTFEQNISANELIEKLNFQDHKNKQIKNFSSGMKQKLKLALAFYTNSEIIFLDEPTSNLDRNAIQWYLDEVQKQISKKLVIISSNQPEEYSFCINQINILNFKK